MAEIVLDHVNKRWGDFVGVQDFDLTIADREFLVLLGPSGCGKTTTMRMIAGLEDATSGTISIDGRVVNDLDPKDRDIAMVFQSYGLYPNMNVYENIRFPLKVRRIDPASHEERVHRAAEMVELMPFLHRKPAELSGGQRQRVALARAVVRQPNAFLMDEPLSNLDAKLRVSTRAQIKNLSHELKVTTIYVTHDQIEAMTLADRVVVMEKGIVQQVGTPTEIYDRPANVFVAGFIGNPAMNLIEGHVEGGTFTASGRGAEVSIPGLPAPAGPATLGFRAEDASVADAGGGVGERRHGGRSGRDPRADLHRGAPGRRDHDRRARGRSPGLGQGAQGLPRRDRPAGDHPRARRDLSPLRRRDRRAHGRARGRHTPAGGPWRGRARAHRAGPGGGLRHGGADGRPGAARGRGGRADEMTRMGRRHEMRANLPRAGLVAGAALLAALPATGARAECDVQNDQPISSLSAGFEAWKAVTDAMAECGNFTAELDQEFRTKLPTAMAAEPSLYDIGGVSNGTITPLLADGTIRPLDELIAEHAPDLPPNRIIGIDGDTMAVAMMVNAQALMYRRDIFEELGLEVPQTWDEVMEAAKAIEEAGVVDYPLGATMKAGWDMAQDFNNMFVGYGGTWVNEDSTPNVNTEAGVNALETMKALTEYMDPEYLVADSTYVQQQLQQGKVAMANFWASRAGAMDDEVESEVAGLVETAAAPRAMEGGPPSTTLWWDGIVIASNISDEEADAAFRVALEGMDTEMVEANNDVAIWLIEGYEPGRLAMGAIQSAESDPPPTSYPSTAEMGLMHTALGNELPAFFTGERSAEETLAAVERAYTQSAKEAGLLQ